MRVFINRDAQRLQDGAANPDDGSDVPPAPPNYESIYQKLIRNGVSVYLHNAESKLHLRCAVIDGRTVISGSCNWWPESFKNKFEDVVVLRSPALAQAYTREIDALLPVTTQIQPVGPTLRPDTFAFPSFHMDREKKGQYRVVLEPVTTSTPFTASVYFSPGHQGLGALMGEIEHASGHVDLAMRWFTNAGFTNRLAQVAIDGKVPVRLLVNRDEFVGQGKPFIEKITATPAHVYASHKRMNMHLKLALIDGREVWTGSANATPRAEVLDVEDMLRLDSPELAAAYQKAYDQLITRLDDKSGVEETKGN